MRPALKVRNSLGVMPSQAVGASSCSLSERGRFRSHEVPGALPQAGERMRLRRLDGPGDPRTAEGASGFSSPRIRRSRGKALAPRFSPSHGDRRIGRAVREASKHRKCALGALPFQTSPGNARPVARHTRSACHRVPVLPHAPARPRGGSMKAGLHRETIHWLPTSAVSHEASPLWAPFHFVGVRPIGGTSKNACAAGPRESSRAPECSPPFRQPEPGSGAQGATNR